MTTDNVKEVQVYLENRGIVVAETTIVNIAIDLVRRSGPGLYAFVCELESRGGKEDQKEEIE